MDKHEISREGAPELRTGYPPTLEESGSNQLTKIELLMAE